MTTTTIKVTSSVRDRLKVQAAAEHRTLGEHLSHLADLGDRQGRLAAVRLAIGSTSPENLASYRDETEDWTGSTVPDLSTGDVVWVSPDLAVGREQSGRRPAMVVAGADYLAVVDTLAVVVPVTGVDRGWPNHVQVEGSELPRDSWAMTEQIRTVSRDRIVGTAGRADESTITAARLWIRDFLDL